MFQISSGITQSGISPSRTYMIGIYDPVSPNEIRFVKVTLPEFAPNTKSNAKLQYLLDNVEEAETTRITVCVSLEEYLNATHSVYTENNKEDIESALRMLYDWNAKQKESSESYSGALTNLLKRVALMDDFDNTLLKLKEMALEILQI